MIESIGTWLEGGKNFYLFLAVAGTAIFVLQFILSAFGGGDDLEVNDFAVDAHDFADIQGLNIFSLKSIVSFVAFFGWGGFFWGHLGWGGLGIALICGLLMMVITAFLIWLLLRLQQSGNVNSTDLIGAKGVVYLTVPGGRQGDGIVTVTLSDRTRQVHARADEELKAGEPIVVAEEIVTGVFLVRRS